MKKAIALFYLVSLVSFGPVQAQKPDRVILFMIDGLHWKAPAKLKMSHFNSLLPQGTYIEKSYMITPHHPTVGEYGKFNTSSFPNPVLHQGTLFIEPQKKMIQEMFSPKFQTAFITNTTAYQSVSRGFTTAIQDPSLTDAAVTKQAIQILENQAIKFMRIHLQTAGNEGRYLSYTTAAKPYYRNIWGKGSPYVRVVNEADDLLGQLVAYLKKSDKWDSTLLIVTADQGQAEIGWHPMITEDSWIAPLLFVGPGIAKNRVLDYFEHTDLAATIAHMMGVEPPNTDGGAGRAISEILATEDATSVQHAHFIRKINIQINEYNSLRAKVMLAAESNPYMSSVITFMENELLTPEPFYHQDRFTEWYRAGTTEHLIEVNEKILTDMKRELAAFKNQ